MMLKKTAALLIAGLFAVSAVTGQTEMSVEESYMEAAEMLIIRETSRDASRDQKMIALEFIGRALERGSTNEEVRTTLEYLSLEGSVNKSIQGGRVVNDYPDIRRQAAKYLGYIATSESKTALIKICNSDVEPMVLQEAIKSLGVIGINENEDATSAIAWVVSKFNGVVYPADDLIALASIDALDKITSKNGGVKNPEAIQAVVQIMNGPFIPLVKERARQTLLNMGRAGGN